MCAVGVGLFVALVYVAIPKPQLYKTYNFSSAVYDRNGKLLKLSLSIDDKYRLFVPIEKVPDEAKKALLLYEDRGFYYHFGVNPFSMIRAVARMTFGGRKVGASTITMQVARIVYHINSATLAGKIQQILRALQIEMFYSKEQILEAYFNIAPYGGNIEGIGAAAQVYFNTKTERLHLPQIMSLSVIPQNPEKRSLLNEKGRQNNREAALRLSKMWRQKFEHRENEYLELASNAGVYLPNEAPHFVRNVLKKQQGEITTTLDLNYQHQAESILHSYVAENKQKGVYNAAAIILDAKNMEVLAYIGSNDFYNTKIQGQVDGVTALRSAGSALKPFIYAMALEKGIIHPRSMLKDVPKNYGLYTPENFDHSFYGLVDATQALVYSRNIPAVELLLKVGENNFYQLLKKSGVPKLKNVEYYGLAMALGGAEVSMQNVAEMYAMLYNKGNFESMHLLKAEKREAQQMIMPEAAFLTLNMLSKNRAVDEISSGFSGVKYNYPVAWKTGTSYGFKDAWSVGVVGDFVVVVWVGNFDGTPNNAFVGRDIAAPLFFRLVRSIGKHHKIADKLTSDTELNIAKVKVCRDTGDIANADCDDVIDTYFIPNVTGIKVSDVARKIPIDVKSGLRACRHTPPQTVMKSYNFWPSDVEQAYAKAGIHLRKPPAF
ncbi:MAG: penicillin-binding protein 1C, partial [Alphaproteobacteria bacterium]|nr:penicillin-binding protein 1C [Alphaproteobacteria bacterium]